MEVTLEPIAVVKSPVNEGVDEHWGEVMSQIVVNEDLMLGLTGLDSFSHVIVVYYMHKSSFSANQDLLRRPQGRKDMPLMGIFAQRARHRPNPIGITPVKLIRIAGNVLTVQGLDAVDGTPVLDLKPYYPVYDLKAGAEVPEWVDRLMKKYF